jgi:glycosyltransferase involved in cell wall biosynthesis
VKKVKKILILANYLGTVYKFRKELVMKLVDMGYEVYVSLPESENNKRIEGLGCTIIPTEVDRRGVNVIKDLNLYLNYKRIIKQVVPDIVIGYTSKPNIYGGYVCRELNIPFIANVTGLGSVFYNGGFLMKIMILLYKLGLKKAKSVFFENIGNAQTFVKLGIISSKQLVVMNGAGVNIDEFVYTPMTFEDKMNILFVGRIMKEKGVDELFEAAKRIKKEYNNVEFGFVGWFEDDYTHIVDELQKEDIIKFYGYHDNVKGLIAKSHCIILPSYHEGMSNTLLEGASMGRPLITTNIHGCKEVVIDGETGYLCDVKSSESLYEKIKIFLQLPNNQKEAMGKTSRNHIEKVFDKRIVVKKTMEIISKAM